MKRAPNISGALAVLLVLAVALGPPGSIPGALATDAPAGQMI